MVPCSPCPGACEYIRPSMSVPNPPGLADHSQRMGVGSSFLSLEKGEIPQNPFFPTFSPLAVFDVFSLYSHDRVPTLFICSTLSYRGCFLPTISKTLGRVFPSFLEQVLFLEPARNDLRPDILGPSTALDEIDRFLPGRVPAPTTRETLRAVAQSKAFGPSFRYLAYAFLGRAFPLLSVIHGSNLLDCSTSTVLSSGGSRAKSPPFSENPPLLLSFFRPACPPPPIALRFFPPR